MAGRSVRPKSGALVTVVILSLCLCLSAAHGVTGYSTEPAVTIIQGNPFLVSSGNWKFLNVTLQYWGSLPPVVSMVLFAVFKNSEDQTVGIATGGITLSSGEQSNAYAVLSNIAPGTYALILFVVSTPDNLPLSPTTTVQVSL